jgi:hypothetical protein
MSYDLDLFGEIAVSNDDIIMWIETVPRIPRDSPRAAYYVEHWNVVGKIRAAKREGTFPFAAAANDEYSFLNDPSNTAIKTRLSHHTERIALSSFTKNRKLT